jgi:hypothetical protein
MRNALAALTTIRAVGACCATVVVAAALTLSVATPARAAATAAQVIAALNAQRQAHGIPGGIVENAQWSAGCDKHITYMQRNGGGLTHDEASGRPGYTPEGAEAGGSSVLARGDSWSEGNPWETAPIHLHQLLGPRLNETGVADRDGYVCVSTWPGYQRPAPASWLTYTYPGPGTAGHRFEETASESPFTPGERVGIPQGTMTGPYLYVMFDGPFASAKATAGAATLTGPSGAVDLAVVDNTTSGAGSYLPPGIELIPRRPLRPRTTYTASIRATLEAQTAAGTVQQPVSHAWTFTTGARPNDVTVQLARNHRRPSSAELSVHSLAPNLVVVLSGPGGAVVRPALDRGDGIVRLPVPGRWRACATSGGGSTEYETRSRCARAMFPARLDVALAKRVSGRRLRLTVPAVAVGSRARIALSVMHRRSAGLTTLRSVRLRRRTTIALPAARRGDRWNVTLSVGGFKRRGVTYERASLSRSYRVR